jgi:hypothetical protein
MNPTSTAIFFTVITGLGAWGSRGWSRDTGSTLVYALYLGLAILFVLGVIGTIWRLT